MKKKKEYEVIIVGGSYSGLAAAMALGRALRKVLVIDSDLPCNRQTPYSHNFITQDGKPPKEIATLAMQQVKNYATVAFLNDLAIHGTKTENGFEIQTKHGKTIAAKKLIFATGIKDLIPNLEGFSECWGISVLHCPYCHGYEVKGLPTGILGNGESGFELAKLISNWTQDLSIFTNGKAIFTTEQLTLLDRQNIKIEERGIQKIKHSKGLVESIAFKDKSQTPIQALYARLPFTQHCALPEHLGCAINEEGYIKVDALQKTSIQGVYVCGDNSSRMRTVANAVSTGTTAGMMLNKEIIEESFTN